MCSKKRRKTALWTELDPESNIGRVFQGFHTTACGPESRVCLCEKEGSSLPNETSRKCSGSEAERFDKNNLAQKNLTKRTPSIRSCVCVLECVRAQQHANTRTQDKSFFTPMIAIAGFNQADERNFYALHKQVGLTWKKSCHNVCWCGGKRKNPPFFVELSLNPGEYVCSSFFDPPRSLKPTWGEKNFTRSLVGRKSSSSIM